MSIYRGGEVKCLCVRKTQCGRIRIENFPIVFIQKIFYGII